MKWTPKMEDKLRKLCFEEKSNADLAKIFNCDVKDIHAARSRLGITIPKIQAAKSQDKPTKATKAASSSKDLNPHIEVKKAFRSLHDTLGIAAISKQTDKGTAKKYINANELLYNLELLLYSSIKKD